MRLTGLTGKEQEEERDPPPADSPLKPKAKKPAKPPADEADKSPFAAFNDYFANAFRRHCGAKYPFNGKQDGPAAKRVLAYVDNDLAAACTLVDRYLTKPDAWLDTNGRTLARMPNQLAGLISRKHPRPTAINDTDHLLLDDKPSPTFNRQPRTGATP